MEKSELEPKQIFNFVGYQFDLLTDLSGPETDIPYWSVDSYRKAGSSGPPTYATHSVTSQKQLEGSRVTGKSYPNPQIPPSSSKVVAGGE